MMSEHNWGVGRGIVDSIRAEKIDIIARQHGAFFVSADIPGDGPKYWFGCRSYGVPHDYRTEQAVESPLHAAGIAFPLGR